MRRGWAGTALGMPFPICQTFVRQLGGYCRRGRGGQPPRTTPGTRAHGALGPGYRACMATKLAQLRELLAEISDLGRARALLAWDERTKMPPAGAESRAEQLATLARIRHQRLVSDELGRLLDEAAAETEAPYDSDEASLVRVARREWEKARRVPAELRAEITRTASLAERAWVAAKESSDFASFLPHLERNVELKRRYAECFEDFEGFQRPYDALLDDYEPGMGTDEVAAVLRELREGVRPLMAAASEGRGAVDGSCLP